MSDPMYVRRDRFKQLILLKSGEIALARKFCDSPLAWHITILTDGGLHPSCVEIDINRDYRRSSSSKYSFCMHLTPGAGTINLGLRWESGHAPYPEIDKMHVWAFGVDLGTSTYPLAPDEEEDDNFKHVATISVSDDGHVTVNGTDAGVWPDMIQ